MDGGDEVHSGQDRGEADDEHAEDRQRHVGAGAGTEGDVKGPACVWCAAATEKRGKNDQCAQNIEPPGEQVEAREGDVAGADLDRHDHVAERARNAGDDEEENHHYAMHGEEGIVGLRPHERPSGGHQFDAQEQPKQHADQEETES